MGKTMDGKPITDVLREMEGGQLVDDLTRKFREVLAAARETRKPGKLTLTLDVKPTGSKTMALDASISAKVPEHDRPGSTFFITRDGQLVSDDEDQPRLPLREVEAAQRKPVEVA
jgi:hypothetical protein